MSFLAPDNLWWAVVAGLVLLLYLVRIGGRRLAVSSYALWQRALARRSVWSRWWQHWVSLVVALIFVGLLVLALCRPFWTAAFERARHVVLVIDASASMNATDVKPSRLTKAKELAETIVDALEPGERAAVVSAGDHISVDCGFTHDTKRVRSALDAIRASEGPTRVLDAVQLARRMAAGRKNSQIILITDGAFDQAEEMASEADLNFVVVAGEPENVGITRLAMRSTDRGAAPEREILVEVANFGSQAARCQLTTRLAGGKANAAAEDALNVEPLEIAAGETVTSISRLGPGAAGLVVAELARDDHLAADDRAQLLVPPLAPRRIVVVAGTDSPVALALGGLKDAEVTIAGIPPVDLDEHTVTVFHGRVPASLPSGPTLVIEPDAPTNLWQLGEAGGAAHRVQGQVTHVGKSPLLAGVDLSRAVFEEKVDLQAVVDIQPLVVDEIDSPLYLLIERPDGAGPVLVLTARLAKSKSDLTLRRDFPLLLANAVRWLGGVRGGVYESHSTSDLIRVTPSPQPRVLQSPDKRVTPLPPQETLVGPLARGGLWGVAPAASSTSRNSTDETEIQTPGAAAAKGPPESVIAVNLVHQAESDIRPRLDVTDIPEHLLGQGPSQPIWMWLVGLAVLICLVEWLLYHRRVLV